MIIDQLPLLGGDVQETDEFPIERGTTTYKTTHAALIKAATDAAAAAQAAADDAQDTADEANEKGLPPGGTAGQVLAKTGPADYATGWINPPDPSGFVSYAEAQTLTAAQQKQARDNIGANWTLLWQNASPTNDFAPQNITVNGLSNYAMIAIAIKTYKADAAVTINLVPYDAGGTRDYPVFTPYLIQRVITWVNNTITFSDCWQFSQYGSYTTTTDNRFLVPYKIYGVNV